MMDVQTNGFKNVTFQFFNLLLLKNFTMEHPLGKKRITEKGRPKAHALHRTNVNNFAAYYVKYSLKLGNLKFGKNEGRITGKLLFQPNRMFS